METFFAQLILSLQCRALHCSGAASSASVKLRFAYFLRLVYKTITFLLGLHQSCIKYSTNKYQYQYQYQWSKYQYKYQYSTFKYQYQYQYLTFKYQYQYKYCA